jgi:putative transcriptional regulator
MIVNMLPEQLRRRGVSIRELSRRTRVTYTTIRAVYHGERRSINLEVLDLICQALDLQPGELYRYLPPGSPSPETGQELPLDSAAVPDKTRTKKRPKSTPGGSDGWVTWE